MVIGQPLYIEAADVFERTLEDFIITPVLARESVGCCLALDVVKFPVLFIQVG